MAEAIALQVVVLHFAHSLDAQRLPGEVLARAPATLPAGHAAAPRIGLRPRAPGVLLQRVLAQRLELPHELLAHGHRERRGHADVLQLAAVIVEAEEQRADRVLTCLVPAEASHDAVGGARVLDLDHRALTGLVRELGRLRDDAVQPRALELLEPFFRDVAVVRHEGEMERRTQPRKFLFQQPPALALRRGHAVASPGGEEVEGDKARRRLL